MGTLLGDVRLSLRHLAKAPGFSAASVLVLALGIGLNAAMFGLVYALVFMGRAFPEPDRLVQLYSSETTRQDSYRPFSYAAYRELAENSEVFSGVLAHTPALVGVGEGGESRRALAALVSRNYFEVLGVPIAQGRGFTAEEDRPDQDIPVAVATYAYWRRTGFRPDLIGSTVRVNERPFTIVGITPASFTGSMSVIGPELFLPLGVFHTIANDFDADTARTLDRPDALNLFIVARLGDGVSPQTAAARLAEMGPQLARAFPSAYRDARVTMGALPRFGTSTSPRNETVLALLGGVLMGLTGAVLLTVCLNLASMLLARGRARRKEFAIRLALGGGRARIVRQLLTEGLMLSLAGGIGGVALGLFATQSLIDALAAALPVTIVLDDALSPALVAAALLFCCLATIAFALGPALRFSRADVVEDLKPQAGDDARERRGRFMPRSSLQVGQVALSLALLIAAGLFVRMAYTAVSVDLGYHADDTVLAEVDSRLGGYSQAQSLDLYADLEQQLGALPGVESAGVGALVPLGMINVSRQVRRAGIAVPPDSHPTRPEEGQAFSAPWNAVSGAYFDAMGLTIDSGRTFTDVESFSPGDARVAIVDEALARRLWPAGDGVGERIVFADGNRPADEPRPAMEVVGIVSATHRQLFEKDLPGTIYVPFGAGEMGGADFHVRPRAPMPALPDLVRQKIRESAAGLPLFSTRTFASHIGSSIEFWTLQLSATLFAAFGGFAMIVALVGIYGVMSYAVVRRTREIGIRMALGARPGAVTRMILGEGLWITLLGLAIGLVLGAGIGQLLSSIFVDLAAFDVAAFTIAPTGFLAAAAAAAWLPARRAGRVDPMRALRTE